MENIEQIIKQQHDYFKTLKTHEYAFRMKQLTLLYQKIKYYQKEIEEALYLDLRKTAFEAYSTEIGYVLSSIENTKKHLKKWMKSKTKLAPYYLFGAYDKIIYRPLGISLIIGPFNYPFQLIFEPLIGAIAAGNCAIIKPSENAIATSKIIAKIIKETFEAEYICCILGDVSTTIQLTHSQVDHIFFTGSIETGKKIMAAASEQLIPVTLELGGKSPVIVDQSAKLKDAVQKIAWGKILNAGQTCVAPDYLIIKEELKDKFIELWKETVNIFLSNDDYGRIINEKHFHRLMDLMDGQEIITGGVGNEHGQIAPTILDNVHPDSPVMQEEIFGPILPLLTYHDIEDVITWIRSRPKPLALYLFS
ncbi:MAG: aldehyde dehydrogenase family protein, partial [Firmicutes bacterium]|nr:aldehyde dehydrogenase family protein [Bacillota bacterium]